MRKTFSSLCSIALLAVSVNAQASGDAKHIPGVFIGATHVDSETEFTFGFEYEYKINQDWGAGVVFERTNDAHHGDGVAVTLASAYYHPTKKIRLGAGFGQESVGGDHGYDEDLFRVSAAYDMHFKGFGIAPTIAIDFVDDEEAVVFGLAITRPF